jgi:hypothetical protein
MRYEKIPTTWTAIASRDRWPPIPLPADLKVEHMWKPIPRAIMSIEQAHDGYMDGKIFKATHFVSAHQILLVVKRRLKAPKITPRAQERMNNQKRFARPV